MSVLIHCLPIFIVQITTAQFPDHIDLQNAGEIIFNNEKYNVFKPRVHKITDHFEDFMMRRENSIKNQKIFIDDNGFRHFWSGLGGKVESLRKTEISLYEVNKNIGNNLNKAGDETTENSTDNTNNMDDDVETNNGDELNEAADENPENSTENVNTDDNVETNNGDDLNEAADENTEKTINNIDTDDNVGSTTNVAVRKKPVRPKTSLEEEEFEKAMLRAVTTAKPAAAAAASGKKVAKVSFFCPFFGVLTMTSFIED